MRFVKIPAILSTVPDLSRHTISRKRQREKRDSEYCYVTV